MSYLHHYPFSSHAAIPIQQAVACGPPLTYSSIANPVENYLYPQLSPDLFEYYRQLPVMEDYDDHVENASRPRLTKDQVDTLEAQFQAHPKPNSNIKRQLAAQTNLSLPRVANWFQNRRAKAKQQKRQEEFERMQREAQEKNKQGNVAEKTNEDADQSEVKVETPGREIVLASTPTQASETSVSNEHQSTPASSSTRPKHQKTHSEATREATFASLQRALNAAVAARDQFTHPTHSGAEAESVDLYLSVRSPNVVGVDDGAQRSVNTAFSEWESSGNTSTTGAWTPSQSPEDSFEFGSLRPTQFTSTDDSLAIAPLESPRNHDSGNADTPTGLSFSQTAGNWSGQLQAQEHGLSNIHAGSESVYAALQLPSLQVPSTEVARRVSSSEELADSLRNVGINPAHQSQSMEALPSRMDGTGWRRHDKELDIAARRKRPRPAAIGTGVSARSLIGPSSMSPTTRSPTTRLPSYGGVHSLRHAKSSHTLGSMYAGVRKLSAAQRSPLGFSTFTEAAAAANSVNVDAKRRLLTSSSSSNLAPPTPLTPEDLQNIVSSPTPDAFISPVGGVVNGHLFPTTQPARVTTESPPATPLIVDMLPQVQYENLGPPQSAPPQYSNFPDYTSCSSGPLTGGGWADIQTIPSPEASSFQPNIVVQPGSLSTVAYEQPSDQNSRATSGWSLTEPCTPFEQGKSSTSVTASMNGEQKVTEFLIHEFPEQQEAHRSVAQQLPPQGPRHYTFANQTLNDF